MRKRDFRVNKYLLEHYHGLSTLDGTCIKYEYILQLLINTFYVIFVKNFTKAKEFSAFFFRLGILCPIIEVLEDLVPSIPPLYNVNTCDFQLLPCKVSSQNIRTGLFVWKYSISIFLVEKKEVYNTRYRQRKIYAKFLKT